MVFNFALKHGFSAIITYNSNNNDTNDNADITSSRVMRDDSENTDVLTDVCVAVMLEPRASSVESFIRDVGAYGSKQHVQQSTLQLHIKLLLQWVSERRGFHYILVLKFKDFQGPWSCIFKDQFSTEVYSMDSIEATCNIYFCDYGTVLVDKNKTWQLLANLVLDKTPV